jgi:hypothetical protein
VISVIEFFESDFYLGIKTLSSSQKVIIKAICAEPLDTETPIPITHEYQKLDREESFANEVELFLWLTDKDEYDPSVRYADADIAAGRRGGKSNIIGAGLALYFATQKDYSAYLGTSPLATIPIISPTKEQANEVYSAIKNMLLNSTYLFHTFLGGKIDGAFDEHNESDIGEGATLTGRQIKLKNKVVRQSFIYERS